jgi:uncharacterized membrane protein YdjX (TVP38/TMEM64 family)
VLLPLFEWLKINPAVGALIYMLVLGFGCCLLLPATLFTVLGGVAFGLWAIPITLLGLQAAILVAFSIGGMFRRTLDDKWARVQAALAQRTILIVALLRLGPIPFGFCNYALSWSNARLRDVMIGSFIGTVPGTVIWVCIGSFGASLDNLNVSWQLKTVIGSASFFFLVALLLFVSRAANRVLETVQDERQPLETANDERQPLVDSQEEYSSPVG